MSKGITEKEADARTVYADIIDHPHHQSAKHMHMSLYDRAAQFASYKALTGYEDMIEEEARRTDSRIELEDADLEKLSRKLNLINDSVASGERPTVSFTCFVPDLQKSGGSYVTVTDQVKRVDSVEQKVILCSARSSGVNESIPISDIIEIHGDLVDLLDSE